MQKTAAVVPAEEVFVPSSLSPSSAQKWLALAVVLGVVVVLLIAAGPLSSLEPRRIEAFVPAYTVAMFVNDSITAILLFAQFSIVRSRAILVIASGYVFTALILIPWILAFPGVFAPGRGLIGGVQTTSWLYFAWHAGFSMFVIGYAFTKDAIVGERLWPRTVRAAVALSIGITGAMVLAVAYVCVAHEELLPRVALDSLHLSPLWPYVGAPVALASVLGLIALWVRRRSMLDLWLMVVMFLYALEIPASYYPTPVRFSVNWYAVRFIGFFASSVVLVVMLYEITSLYSRLVGAVRGQRQEREARLVTGDVVAATIAHEVQQPVSGMITNADAGFRFLDRSVPDLDEAKAAFKQIVADGHRAADVIRSIRTIFRKDVPNRVSLDLNELILTTLALVREDLAKHRIRLDAALDDRLPQITGDRIQLQQVLLNLMTNAIESMAAISESGALSVRSRRQGDGKVSVSIADTGSGISPEDRNRIFNPLFTTKPDGMGMGLSICRSIMEAHDGRLRVAANTPRGAVFELSMNSSAPA